DLLEGETLRALLDRDGPLEERRAARILRDVAAAVAAAHARGVVHRDLKPDNVVLLDGDRVRVLDFGVAKLVGPEADEGPAITVDARVVGTPAYMAPEQVEGATIDARADVWALGVTLYELVSGIRPIEGRTPGEVMRRLLTEGIAPLSTVAPNASP